MLPVAASPKKGGGRARPPASRCPLRVRDSFYISIYIYLPIPLYSLCIYIYTSLSLSF